MMQRTHLQEIRITAVLVLFVAKLLNSQTLVNNSRIVIPIIKLTPHASL